MNEKYNFIDGGLVPASCRISSEEKDGWEEAWDGSNISLEMLMILERVSVKREDYKWAGKIRDEIKKRL